jgi:hypothetical protein
MKYEGYDFKPRDERYWVVWSPGVTDTTHAILAKNAVAAAQEWWDRERIEGTVFVVDHDNPQDVMRFNLEAAVQATRVR